MERSYRACQNATRFRPKQVPCKTCRKILTLCKVIRCTQNRIFRTKTTFVSAYAGRVSPNYKQLRLEKTPINFRGNQKSSELAFFQQLDQSERCYLNKREHFLTSMHQNICAQSSAAIIVVRSNRRFSETTRLAICKKLEDKTH